MERGRRCKVSIRLSICLGQTIYTDPTPLPDYVAAIVARSIMHANRKIRDGLFIQGLPQKAISPRD